MKNHWNKVYKAGRKFTPVSEIVLDNLQLTGKTALDIGCGTGELTRQLKARGFSVTGIDTSDYAIEQAKRIDREILYLTGKFEQSALDGRYDVIVVNKVLAFVENPKGFLEKAKDLLNNGGKLVLITPVRYDGYKYSEHLTAISMDFDKLNHMLIEVFGHSVVCMDKRYFDDYGCELTLLCSGV